MHPIVVSLCITTTTTPLCKQTLRPSIHLRLRPRCLCLHHRREQMHPIPPNQWGQAPIPPVDVKTTTVQDAFVVGICGGGEDVAMGSCSHRGYGELFP